MPFQLIRQDITKVECDAIVNAANNSLLGGGGVDGAIHRAAGPRLLEECRTLGGCETGDAKITKGYDLHCKYVIHTVGPVWHGRAEDEWMLRSCYINSFKLAKKNKCESIAFPLISAGVYGYPPDEALNVAISETKRFLQSNEMTVYIVLFDKKAFEMGLGIEQDIQSFIDDDYSKRFSAEGRRSVENEKLLFSLAQSSFKEYAEKKASAKDVDIGEYIKNMDESFAVKLLKLIDMKNMDDVECYKKANVSRQTFYKIMNDGSYKPSKNTILSFAVALELSIEETKELLGTVGFTLSRSLRFDRIIEYCIIKGIYDVYYINMVLFKYDQPGLGVI